MISAFLTDLQVPLEVLELVFILNSFDGIQFCLLCLTLRLVRTICVLLHGGFAPLGGDDVPGQAVASLVEPWPLLLKQHLVAGRALSVICIHDFQIRVHGLIPVAYYLF